MGQIKDLQSSPRLATILLAAILLVVAFALIVSRHGWPLYLEVFSHFQAQYFILSLGLLGLLRLTRRRWPVWLGLLCCGLLSAQLLPWYLPPHRFLRDPAADLRVLVINVNKNNHQYSRVLELVRQEQPDFAVFIEIDANWIPQLDRFRQDLLPYAYSYPGSGVSGIAVYSRHPLNQTEVQFFGSRQAAITGQFRIGQTPIAFVAAHPLPPASSQYFAERNQQMEQISQYMQTLQTPMLLLGDLNMTMWSPYYRRLIKQTGLSNTRDGFGILPSWPTRGNGDFVSTLTALLFPIPIDHGLISSDLEVADMSIGSPVGSDHLPLLMNLRLAPGVQQSAKRLRPVDSHG